MSNRSELFLLKMRACLLRYTVKYNKESPGGKNKIPIGDDHIRKKPNVDSTVIVLLQFDRKNNYQSDMVLFVIVRKLLVIVNRNFTDTNLSV